MKQDLQISQKLSEVTCAKGTTADVLGGISLPLTILDRNISTKFKVMQGGRSNIYLGIPFLHRNSAILTFNHTNENSLSLIIGMPVLGNQHLEIAPNTEIVVPCVLQIPVPPNQPRIL